MQFLNPVEIRFNFRKTQSRGQTITQNTGQTKTDLTLFNPFCVRSSYIHSSNEKDVSEVGIPHPPPLPLSQKD